MPNTTTPPSHRALRGVLPLAAILLAACSALPAGVPATSPENPAGRPDGSAAPSPVGPASSPTPDPSPTPGSTPTPDRTPTAPPTAEPTSGGEIAHPTGPTDIVLRMEVGGGFVPVEWMLTSLPTFTLYGDNTAVFQPVDTRANVGFDAPRLALLRATMNDEQVDALLRFALTTGRLLDARAEYTSDGIADASTTTFTIDAGGVDKTVAVYALGLEMPGQAGPDGADRQGFARLAELLTNFEKEARAGQVDEVTVYEPDTYRVMLIESGGGQGGVEWPWDDVALDDFEKTGEFGPLVAGMAPDQVAGIVAVPHGGAMGWSMVAPDGETVYGLAIRPLLPGETVEIEDDRLG